MDIKHFRKTLAALFLLSLWSSSANADVVETKNGAKLIGKVVAVDGAVISLDTDYAGTVKIKQSEVVSLTTEAPLNVRLSTGTVLQGTISSTGAGALAITGPDGAVSTNVSKVSATWAPGAPDPAVVALTRNWTYELGLDVTGKTGNSEQIGTAVNGRASLKTAQDTLEFYANYDRQVADHSKSADQLKIGVDYSNNFSGKYSWYVRDEGGFDRVKDIELYNTAAGGLGYDFIKLPKQTLTVRAGVSFRYEGYKNPMTPNVDSTGLDFGLNHTKEWGKWSMTNRLSYDPLFEDFTNYRIIHESYFEIPTADPTWKLRLGLSNDYNSKPGAHIERLDTTYFTRLVIDWK